MKKQLLLFIALLLTGISYGQLTGVKTIPGDYATIAAAITDLNTVGVGAGGVTFNVAAGTAETFTTLTAGLITATGTLANPIVFQKSGVGVNPKITACTPGVSTSVDYIICLAGSDYVTFDGIDLQENALNLTPTTQMEWGYALVKKQNTAPFDGCQNVVIKNCAITLNKANTAAMGIYAGNHISTATASLTITATTDALNNCKFYGNTISNCYGAIWLNGFAAATPFTLYDQNNEIGVTAGNTISNLGAGSASVRGIYGNNQNGLKIANNTLAWDATGATTTVYGIFTSLGTSSNVDIYGNTISFTFTAGAYTSTMYGINNAMGSTALSNVVNIYNNTIQNCNLSTVTTGGFQAILNSGTAATVNIYGNTVSGNTLAGTGDFYGINNTAGLGTNPLNMYSNTVSGNSKTGSGGYMYCARATTATIVFNLNNIYSNSITGGTGYLYGYYNVGSPVTESYYNNNIYGLTHGGTGYVYGMSIVTASGTKNVYGNNIYQLSSAGGIVYGYSSGYGSPHNFYNNKIYNLTSTTSAGVVYGVDFSPTTLNCYNNFISDLKAPAATGTNAVVGINLSGGTTLNAFNNTVYLNATSSSATTFGTSGISKSATVNGDIRNNIIINVSTPGPTGGFTVAHRWSGTYNATYYAATSNNNDFYSGTPAANRLIFYDGTNSDQTIAAYKSRVSPRDASSITENPPFVNVGSTPYDLHLMTTIPTQCESGGIIVSTPVAITTDYDNNARYPNAGYPNNALSPAFAPDMGADEFAGLFLDLVAPVITYTPFLNTSSTSARVLTTTITDGSGVPTSGAGLPQLYWRINSGSWNSVAGIWISGSTYTFTFGAGAVITDIVSYYVVAQDLASTPNIGSNPSAGATGFTINPPAAATPPTSPNAYTIVGTICGTKTIGVPGDYATLTAAVAAINGNEISCPITLLIQSTYNPTGETFPIVINANSGSSAINTLTIKPDAGVTAAITGASASGPMIKVLNSNTIIDGSNTVGGTTRNLTISNTSLTTPQVLVIGSTGTTPVTNVVVKNSVMINGVNTSSALIISDGAAPGTAGYFNNITLQNNSIQKAYIAVYITAIVAAGNGSGLMITGNDLSTSGTNSVRLVGLYVQGVDGATISDNTIGNFANTADASNLSGIWLATGTINATVSGNTINTISGTSAGPRGIAVSSGIANSNIMVIGNTITNLSTSSTLAPFGIYLFSTTTGVTLKNNKVGGVLNSNTGGYGARGINVVTGLAASNINIINNLVYDVKCTSDAGLAYWNLGIALEGATGGVNVYHNSVYLSGTYAGYTSATISAAFYAGTSNTAIDLRDNIFVNTYDNTTSTTDKSFAIYSDVANTAFTNINYNDYFVSGAPGILGHLVSDITTLAAWKTATGQDVNSQNIDPLFTSVTNLTPTNGALGHLGTYLPLVPADINGVLRANPPDMGAIEFALNPLVNTTAATLIFQTTASLNGTINANGMTVNSFFDYGLTTAYGTSAAGTPASVTGSTATAISLGISGLTAATTYHYRARGVTSTGVIVYGPDMTFTTLVPAPTITTTAAAPVGSTTATLNGTANANGSATAITFEYGLTAAYGTTVPGVPPTVNGITSTPISAAITGLVPNTLYHYHAVGVNPGGPADGGDMTFTTLAIPPIVTTDPASSIGLTSATMNGTVNANNASTTVSFEYGLTLAYGTVVAATPSPVNGVTPTAVSANLSGLLTNTTYHYRAIGSSIGGASNGLDMTFLTGCPQPAPAGPISGPISVCQNGTGYVYTVGTIVNAISYAWTLPAGGSFVSGGGTNSITVAYNTTAVSGNITVEGVGTCGNGPSSSLPVTVNPMPVPTITGPATSCEGSTSNVYVTQPGMTGYVWTVSAGGSISGGGTTNTITVTWSTSGPKTVTANYANANGCMAAVPASYAVTVNVAPVPTITGATSMCVNSGYFDYETEPGFTGYAWTISPGGVINYGSGTNVVQVSWIGSGPQWIAVNYNNASGCAASSPVQLAVNVTPPPSAASTITGTATVCGGTNGVAYSTAAINGALTYVWALPAGATIATGAGTNSITVDFAGTASSGNITVYGNNLCGNGTLSPAFPVTVNPLPVAAGTITGTASVCNGATGVVYTIPTIVNATTYNWTVPAGVTITSGANTATITVDFTASAVSGIITVAGNNACGNGPVSPDFAVTVNPIPATPVITDLGPVLTSSAALGNQWYFSATQGGTGAPISGATAQTYTATLTGYYWDVVTLAGCSSDTSNHLYIVIDGVSNPLTASAFAVYPVPSDGKFTVSFSGKANQTYSINVYNSLGSSIFEQKNIQGKGNTEQTIDLRPVAPGVYTVIFSDGANRLVKKMVVR